MTLLATGHHRCTRPTRTTPRRPASLGTGHGMLTGDERTGDRARVRSPPSGAGCAAVGSVVAGYRVERLLGVGGMGAVYEVANPELLRRNALKVLSAELLYNEEFRARFLREADVASMLDPPDIVSIYRRGRTRTACSGLRCSSWPHDADAALKTGTMTPARAVYVVGEVAKALDYAHAHQVVHRDIKPANFLLSGPVGEERVLFGRLRDRPRARRCRVDRDRIAGGHGRLHRPRGAGRGQLRRACRPVFVGLHTVSAADRQAPFPTASGPGAVMMAHLHAPPPRVSDEVAGLSPALDAVIAKAMAKDPAQRFSLARELADAAAVLVHQPAGATTRPWQPVPAAAVSSYPDAHPSGPQWGHTAGGPPTQRVSPPRPPSGAPRPWPPPPPRSRVGGTAG